MKRGRAQGGRDYYELCQQLCQHVFKSKLRDETKRASDSWTGFTFASQVHFLRFFPWHAIRSRWSSEVIGIVRACPSYDKSLDVSWGKVQWGMGTPLSTTQRRAMRDCETQNKNAKFAVRRCTQKGMGRVIYYQTIPPTMSNNYIQLRSCSHKLAPFLSSLYLHTWRVPAT